MHDKAANNNGDGGFRDRIDGGLPLLGSSLPSHERRETFVRTGSFETMSLDALWALHVRLTEVLARRVESKKLAIERQLAELGHRFCGPAHDISQARPRPPVRPKFSNPDEASETWSGRGRQPLRVAELLAHGGSLEDCRIQKGSPIGLLQA